MPPRKKPKLFFRRFVAFTIAVALIGCGYVMYLWWSTVNTRMVRYPEFGIPIPTNYGIHGIDVSRYQQDISWEAVKEMNVSGVQLGFAFIKATEGGSNVDPYFKRNWKKSKDAGVIRGAYHFFIASKDGRLQAENFINTVTLESGDLPPVLDIENTGGTKPEVLRAQLTTWLKMVEEYYGTRPIIYTYLDFYTRNMQGYFDDYPLWVAHYLQPDQPRITRPWTFWQHSESGHVNGIISKVDFNVFSGDSLQFRALLVP